MKVVGLCGYSGAGKTRLAEGLIQALRAAGCTVSVVKHAHKGFDIDLPGKDSHRHREAGAFEVVVASSRRIARIREYRDAPVEPTVPALLAELTDLGPDHWVLVEGFKHADLPKIEVWRAARGGEPLYPQDRFITAVACTGSPPVATGLPVLDLDDAGAIARFLMQDGSRYDYAASASADADADRPGLPGRPPAAAAA